MKLTRPHISVFARCRVGLRQLGTLWPDEAIDARRSAPGGLTVYLSELLERLAELLGCEAKELRLDHLPALALRKKVFRNGIHVDYDPPCDSADDLIYRTHVAHLVKTNHHGDGAQHPDRVLIAKNRRMERREQERRGLRKPKRKAKISSQPLRSRNTFPPKGGRPFRRKP